jgi:hypothetical protein
MRSIFNAAIFLTGAASMVYFILYMNHATSDLTTRYKVVTLNSGTFDIGVKIIVTDDTAFALRYVRENLDSTASSQEFDARAVTFGTIDGKSPIIWMPYNTPIEVSNHELLHATINIMHWAGVPLNDTTEEVYAYEMQYLSEEFYNQINKIK